MTAPRPSSAPHVGRERSLGRERVSPRGAGLGASLRLLAAALQGLPAADQGQGRVRRPLRPRAAAARPQLQRATSTPTTRGRPGTRTSPASACTAPTASSSPSAPSATARRCGPLPPTPYLVVERTTRVVARDGLFSFEGRRYAVPDARPGERVELVLGATELEVYSTVDGRRLARHERGRPAKVLPDPVENSVSLAQVLDALPEPEVHRRPLSVYQELDRWLS